MEESSVAKINEIVIRECATLEELDGCVGLQRDVFGLADLEVSPRRHLVVSKRAGGWTLGAFAGHQLVGFVHHLVALRNNEVIGYSHMMAVKKEFQNSGIGAKLKWAQRARAIAEGRRFITWTWDPLQTRNAHFNLNRLGAIVREYAVNFYGTDYHTTPDARTDSPADLPGIDSDRLFADWHLDSPRVARLAVRREPERRALAPVAVIKVPLEWAKYIRDHHPASAQSEQQRVRAEFQQAFADKLICAGFERTSTEARYLFFHEQAISAVHGSRSS